MLGGKEGKERRILVGSGSSMRKKLWFEDDFELGKSHIAMRGYQSSKEAMLEIFAELYVGKRGVRSYLLVLKQDRGHSRAAGGWLPD